MTEAERLRSEATRCAELAKTATDRVTADILVRAAAKIQEQAADLERADEQRPAESIVWLKRSILETSHKP
jgi:hypothetical protein